MEGSQRPESTILIIFGAGGDLTWRKLVPALYNLYLDRWLPEHFVDNWRWQDVPFYLRTGKRLLRKLSEAVIQFRPVPHQPFPFSAIGNWQSNYLVIQVQPDEGVRIHFQARRPGAAVRLSPVDMRFSYCETFHSEPPEAYETLLLDVMLGDATLFKRDDQVEASWKAVMPVLEGWAAITPDEFPNYQAGSWGPEESMVLIAQDGRSWVQPALEEEPSTGDEGEQAA